MLRIINNTTDSSSLLEEPGDRAEMYITPSGDKICKVSTKKVNMTLRQYHRKNGTAGKRTIMFKETDR